MFIACTGSMSLRHAAARRTLRVFLMVYSMLCMDNRWNNWRPQIKPDEVIIPPIDPMLAVMGILRMASGKSMTLLPFCQVSSPSTG